MNIQDRAREITLPVSGKTLKVVRISPLLLDDFFSSLPRPPDPPSQRVEYAGGVVKEEPNAASPEYQVALDQHAYHNGLAIIDFCIELGVECEVDAEAVAKLRKWGDRRGVTLPEDDKLLYVSRILTQGNEDLVAIRQAVLGRVQPTEEAVEKAADSFPGEVSGA